MLNKPFIGLKVHCILFISKLFRCITSPIFFSFLLFFSVIWLLYEVPSYLPAEPKPPTFMWLPNFARNLSVYINFAETETSLLNLKIACSATTEILFVVPSSVNNTKKRNAIRKTWGSWIKTLSEEESEMRLIFMLGKDLSWEDNTISSPLLEESNTFHDIVIEDFIDSYTNLTLKSVYILKWVLEKCHKVKFVVKADDDMFINVPNLLISLEDVKTPAMLGNLICNARPIQNKFSKWYSPSYMFKGKYPNYLSGTAYVLSGDIIHKLLTMAIQTPYFHLEDVYLTGICAKKLRIRPINMAGFSYVHRPFNPCVFNETITVHEVLPKQMIRMWNMLHNPSVMRRCKPQPQKVLNPSTPLKCKWK